MRTFVYIAGRERGPIKIGITTNLFARLRALQTGCPFPIELLYVATFEDKDTAREYETTFHDVHADVRLSGEWFNLDAELAVESLEYAIDIRSPSFAAWESLYHRTRGLQ